MTHREYLFSVRGYGPRPRSAGASQVLGISQTMDVCKYSNGWKPRYSSIGTVTRVSKNRFRWAMTEPGRNRSVKREGKTTTFNSAVANVIIAFKHC
jgi:hypothetical protein